MDEVPRSAEERAVARSGLLQQTKAEIAAGRFEEAERLQLASINFSARCELQDARLDQKSPPDELAWLEEDVRVTGAGLEKLAAAAPGER